MSGGIRLEGGVGGQEHNLPEPQFAFGIVFCPGLLYIFLCSMYIHHLVRCTLTGPIVVGMFNIWCMLGCRVRRFSTRVSQGWA